jgi:integrase
MKAMGAHAPATPSKRTLDDYMDEWMSRLKVRWTSNTIAQREDIIKRWIRPHIGHVPLKELGTQRLEEWRTDILAKGCPPKQSNKALAILSSALGTAVRWRLLPENPTRHIDAIPTERSDHPIVTPHEVEAIRSHLASPVHRLLVSVIGYAGLRPQEALALNWTDIVHGHIQVKKARQRDGTIDRPKSKAGYRMVPMIRQLQEEIESLRQPSGFIFPADRSVAPMDWHNWSSRYFRPALEAAGLSMTPYDLRHAYASLMIQAGESVVTVAARMGHSRPSMTLDVYAHDYQMRDAVGIATPEEMVDLARKSVGGELGQTAQVIPISSRRSS